MKDYKEMYDKTDKHFKAKARKECARPGLTFKGHLPGKLIQLKSGQAPKEMTECQVACVR